MLLVDTCIWSEALRKSNAPRMDVIEQLKIAIKLNRAGMIGPIRQELLSGIKSNESFQKLKSKLSSFEDIPVITQDYELATEIFNSCRKKGIQGSNTDFLICAVSLRLSIPIFTYDRDFELYKSVIKISVLYPQ